MGGRLADLPRVWKSALEYARTSAGDPANRLTIDRDRERGEELQLEASLPACYRTSASRSPITPSTISAIETSRKASRGSSRKKMPTRAVPTAPIPTQTA